MPKTKDWDAIAAELDDDDDTAPAKPAPPPPPPPAAAGALNDLLSMGADTSFAEIKSKMMNLPEDAKKKFLDHMGKPGVMESLTKKMDSSQAGQMLVGLNVKIVGLVAKPELNGKSGKVVEFITAKGRCAVQLDDGGDKILLKPTNIDASH